MEKSVRKINPKTLEYEYYNLNCDVREFQKFGIGLQLYFKFMHRMAFVFFAMFCLSLPAMMSNYFGNFLSFHDSFLYVLKTTLANQERFSPKYDSSTNSTVN